MRVKQAKLLILLFLFALNAPQAFGKDGKPATKNEGDYVAVAENGTVTVRPTAAEKQVPERFRHTGVHDFQFKAKYARSSGPVRVYKVTFPSPVTTDVPANNTVYGDYFQPAGRGPFPGVVVLHILGGEFSMSRMIANGLARHGIAALFIKMPYYGERRVGTSRRYLSLDPDETLERFTQGVADIRRAAAWIGDRPEVDGGQLGLTGISLGGIMSGLAGPVEPRFKKIAIYLGGGNLGEMIWQHNNRSAREFRKRWLDSGETKATFLAKSKPADPVTYAHLLKDRQVLMVAAKHDEIVPPAATLALWNAAGRKPRLVWLDAGHISAAQFLFGEMQRLNKFFEPVKKPATAKKDVKASRER